MKCRRLPEDSRIRKSSSSPGDIRGAGGNLYSGWRTIRKGGIIRFDGAEFQSDQLTGHAGARAHCTIAGDFDIWYAPQIEVVNQNLGIDCSAVNTREKDANWHLATEG